MLLCSLLHIAEQISATDVLCRNGIVLMQAAGASSRCKQSKQAVDACSRCKQSDMHHATRNLYQACSSLLCRVEPT